jgi:hypothetical protein
MNEKRLLRLAKRLESLKANRGRRFDLKYWYRANCETTACAIGEAGLLKEFNKEGFTLTADLPPDYNFGVDRGHTVLIPMFEGKTNNYAVEAFFGIALANVNWLFLEHSYGGKATAKDVAKRIRMFVAERRPS